MKTIPELYNEAKINSKKIPAYLEAVENSISSPHEYLSNIEYIISSDIGMRTFESFTNTYGIPMSGIGYIIEGCNNAIKKCNQRGLDATVYKNMISSMESYKDDHAYSSTLYENKNNDYDYLKLFEESLKCLKEGKKLAISNIISRYGEAAIPDLILAHKLTDKMEWLTEGFNKPSAFNSPTFYQWLMESYKEFGNEVTFYEKSLEGVVAAHNVMIAREFTESMLLRNNDLVNISESQMQDIEELIRFKEYAITFLKEDKAIKAMDEIYDLYQDYAFALDDSTEFSEDIAQSVIPMLPQANNPSVVTEDNMSGDAPKYLAKSHDMSYGEEDDIKPHKDDLKDYERPKKINPKDLEDDTIEELKDDIKNADTPKEKQQAINNYYYYTYTHSFNTSADDKSIKINSNSPSSSISDNHDQKNAKNAKDNVEEIKESAEDVENDKPTSTTQDTLMDIDRSLTKVQQKAKNVVQGFINVGATFLKPFKRTSQWISKMVNDWRSADENKIKERMASPHKRSLLFKAIRASIVGGALFKAGLLLNPVFLYLAISRKLGQSSRENRIRKEMVGELRTEIEVIEEKIKDADRNNDNKAKYKLMRLKNEINKKLIRVGINLHGTNKSNVI